MKDVSEKNLTHREAIAEALITMPPEIQTMLRDRKLEKGDALEIGRAAGIMAAKRTWDLIPFCHPLPISHVSVDYTFEDEGVRIRALVKTYAPTGVEMEALVAANMVALTLYDMLKPHTQALEIRESRLLYKKGGKSGEYRYRPADD